MRPGKGELFALVVDIAHRSSLSLGPTFEVIVRRHQKELSGPSQHCIIAICMSYDSHDDSQAIAQLYIGQKRDTTICCVFF